MKPHDQKQIVKEMVYLAFTSISLFITGGSQGRSPEAGADAEAMEGLLTDLLHLLAQPAFLFCLFFFLLVFGDGFSTKPWLFWNYLWTSLMSNSEIRLPSPPEYWD